MLNKHKAAKEAARVLLGLSMSHFDGEDCPEAPKPAQVKPWMVAAVAVVVIVVDVLVQVWRHHAG